ncbi:metal ABC transporter substrate-binding protein [Bordetella sp. N]|uniref:metal ABC transporter substrate-binding protein n=1 Tax=Bordetella sp. N TaxID=1746199 RepID=UPI000709D315|nr:metal ABC transporter substrate-binding protein [Bordetella sp. N]ALM85254.1 ABC transporter substrate-binding protein [Bordetella sp. N]
MAHTIFSSRFLPLRRRALAALALAAAGLAVGGTAYAQTQAPGSAPATAPTGPLKVVASFSILGDMVKQIGGSDVQLDVLVGPDGDAHEYEPTPADARRLAAAQVLVVNGLGFEAWLPKLVRASGFKGSTVVASEGVKPRDFGGDATGGHDHAHGGDKHDDHKHGDGHGHEGNIDPHAWQSLANGAQYARNIGAALAAADAAHADAYRQRADAYVARIEALNERVKQAFAALPAERRRVVTSHDAFGYFGDAYGMTFISAMGISTEAEPSAADVARIVSQIRQDKVPAVFVENVSSPKLAQQIARETGARVGGTLYSDALAKPGLPAATYLGMFEWNLSQFMAALKP